MHAAAVKDLCYQISARNLLLKEESLRLVRLLSGIPCILLKGAAFLLQDICPSSMRYTGDIDILIRPCDFQKVRRLLAESGYHTGSHLTGATVSPYLNSVSFVRDAQIYFIIHLHWHLLNTTLPLFFYRIDMNRVWERAVPLDDACHGVLVLRPEDELVYACIHAFSHSFRKRDLQDIGRMLLRYKEPSFKEAVCSMARAWKAEVPLYCALALLDERPCVEIANGRLKRCAEALVCSVREKGEGSHNQVYPLYCAMAGTILRRVKFVFLTVLPPPSVMRRIYSAYPDRPLLSLYLLRLSWAVRSL